MDGQQVHKVYQAEGVTPSERYLQRLCRHTFLSLWSYSGVHRNQGNGGNAEGGKEVCDLLVVFENHVIIFSDKDSEFPNTGKLELDWSRWFRRAVMDGAKQIWGAERWIKSYPDRLFLDPACTQPFPINLPSPADMIVHRIIVARGASKRCKEILGGSGSLMVDSKLVGEMHYNESATPFTIGQIDPNKGYIHIFDDTTLDIVMKTLDTITDFVWYLAKKEKLMNRKISVHAAGEEELLAVYLSDINTKGEHDFKIPLNYDAISWIEGFWEDFSQSPQRQAQIAANEISYMWDEIIEKFNEHIINDTQHYTTHSEIKEIDKAVRFFAREPRTQRRVLAKSLIEMMEKTPATHKAVRVGRSSLHEGPYYVFLLLPEPDFASSYEEYREVRRNLLGAYCLVTKLKYPDATDIVGIATETGLYNDTRSEDAVYFDASQWTAEQEAEAQSLQRDLRLLEDLTAHRIVEHEYPETEIVASPPKLPKNPRNKPCPCGSGKKYKNCCLKKDRSKQETG